MISDLEKEMRQSADFITEREMKVCLDCGYLYSTEIARCNQCGSLDHTKILLNIATWKTLPPHLADGRPGPGVRVTNIGGNAVVRSEILNLDSKRGSTALSGSPPKGSEDDELRR